MISATGLKQRLLLDFKGTGYCVRASSPARCHLMMPGSQLGAYQVVAQLGAGGMGEVLRARDRRLNRDVAVKVLPTNFARDVERLCRCGQEARTFAVSSHPHVLTVHHAGVHDGVPCPASKLLTTLREEMNGRAFPGAKRSLQEYRK